MKFGFAQYPEETLSGHDFRRNMDTAWELDGQYSTDVFTGACVNLIRTHNRSSPLFLYVGHEAVHAGNAGKPLEAPQEVINNFTYIPDPNRRSYAGKFSFNYTSVLYTEYCVRLTQGFFSPKFLLDVDVRPRAHWQHPLQNYLVAWIEHTALYDTLPKKKTFQCAQSHKAVRSIQATKHLRN
jgi:hypothetical protein